MQEMAAWPRRWGCQLGIAFFVLKDRWGEMGSAGHRLANLVWRPLHSFPSGMEKTPQSEELGNLEKMSLGYNGKSLQEGEARTIGAV